jgi:hypothetical protein
VRQHCAAVWKSVGVGRSAEGEGRLLIAWDRTDSPLSESYQGMMRSVSSCRLFAVLVSVVAFVSSFCIPARADHIVLIVEENGQQVYINVPSSSPSFVRKTGESRRPDMASPVVGFSAPISRSNIERAVSQTAGHYGLDPRLVDAVIRVESHYDARAVSPKGAMGLMQLIPATAERFGVGNPFDPKQNIRGGVRYLHYLLKLFDGDLPLALAAYNSGEHTVERSQGVPDIPETQSYVRKVTQFYGKRGQVYAHRPAAEPTQAPVYQYLDREGVIHFTNDGGV